MTRLLHHGGNSLNVELGNGMANVPPTASRYEKLTRSDGLPKFIGQLEITYADGRKESVPVLVRIDTLDELDYYRHGGILHYVLRNLVAA